MPRTKLLVAGGAALVLAALVYGLVRLPRIVAADMNRVTGAAAPEVSREAARLHARILVADLHADALLWRRDLLERDPVGHVDVPRLIDGNVALQVFSVVTKTPRGINHERNTAGTDNVTLLAVANRWPLRTWGSLEARALYQAEKLRRFAADSEGRLTVIRSRDELSDYLDRRADEPEITAGVLALEGTHALEGDLGAVDRLFDAGFRIVGLTHFFDNAVGGSAHGVEKGGLTDFGRRVLGRLEERRMIVDLAHASPALFDDVLATASRPPIVSHAGVQATCPGPRNLTDDQLRRLADAGGIVGIGLWDGAVCEATVEAAAAALVHAISVVGPEHVALGSDFDGATTTPIDAAGLPRVTEALLGMGLSDRQVAMVMGGNVMRFLGTWLP
ncbi:MAG: membrane dipeptidase [Gemmatimonadota bacterium]|jgi:microsomal dipeptidase-like Zn-dependent dipeptidase